MLIRTAAILLCVAVAPAAAQTFSRVETHPGLGTMEHILAVADLNGTASTTCCWVTGSTPSALPHQ